MKLRTVLALAGSILFAVTFAAGTKLHASSPVVSCKGNECSEDTCYARMDPGKKLILTSSERKSTTRTVDQTISIWEEKGHTVYQKHWLVSETRDIFRGPMYVTERPSDWREIFAARCQGFAKKLPPQFKRLFRGFVGIR